MIYLTQFIATIWAKHNTMEMEQNLEEYDFDLKNAYVKIMKKNTNMRMHLVLIPNHYSSTSILIKN